MATHSKGIIFSATARGFHLFQALAENVPLIIFTANAAGVPQYFNEPWFAFTGQTRDEAHKSGLESIIHRMDRAAFEACQAQAFSSGKEASTELRIRRHDGAYCWHRLTLFPYRDEPQHLAGWIGTLAELADTVQANVIDDLAQRTPALLFIADANGQAIFMSDRWADVLGRSKSALLGRGWMTFVHPDDRQQAAMLWHQQHDTDEGHILRLRFKHITGAYRWMEIRMEPERNPEGQIGRWFGIGTDVDEQQRASAALKFLVEAGASIERSTDPLALLARIADAATADVADICVFDILGDNSEDDRRVVVATPAVPKALVDFTRALRTTGARMDSSILCEALDGRTVYIPRVDARYINEHVHPQARRDTWVRLGVRSVIATPLASETGVLGVLTALRTVTAMPFERNDVRIFEDVARRAATAIENIRLHDALRKASFDRTEHFRRIADLTPHFMTTSDPQGNAVWFNQQWYAYTGQTPEQALGDGWADVVHPEDVQHVKRTWAESIATGNAYECEMRIRREDGVYRWFLARGAPERDEHGAVVKWYVAKTDIHEKRRAVRTMQAFADIGETLNASLGLQATLDAAMHRLVPEYADWAFIMLRDPQDEPRVAAVYHADGKEGARLRSLLDTNTAPPNEGPTLELPLAVGGNVRGTLVLCMSGGGRTFDQDDLPFYRELARRMAPAIANAEIYERERLVARSFQDAALPSELPECEGYAFDAIYEAGRAEALIGGDWYDAFRLLDGRIVVSIGDVAGAGLEAAVTMSRVRQAIRGVAQVRADPDLLVAAADRVLRSEEPERFVTAFVGVIDTTSNVMTYQCAGHYPPILCTLGGCCSELERGGLPLGLRGEDEPQARTVELVPGSMLVLYTDGLIESTHDIMEGEQRLHRALSDVAMLTAPRPAQSLHDIVLHDGSKDDVAILTVVIREPSPLHRWTIDTSDPERTRAVQAEILVELAHHGIADDATMSAELVIAELIGNLVRHAPGEAEVLLDWNERVPVLHVKDRGPGFEFAAKLPKDILSESGRGLFLVSQLSQDFHVTARHGGGSHARAVLKV